MIKPKKQLQIKVSKVIFWHFQQKLKYTINDVLTPKISGPNCSEGTSALCLFGGGSENYSLEEELRSGDHYSIGITVQPIPFEFLFDNRWEQTNAAYTSEEGKRLEWVRRVGDGGEGVERVESHKTLVLVKSQIAEYHVRIPFFVWK